MTRDSLGDRMKAQCESRTRYALPPIFSREKDWLMARIPRHEGDASS